MKRKVIACLLAGAMVFSLTACGSGVSSKKSGEATKNKAESEVGVEQTAKPGPPPSDAKIGGQFIVRNLPGSLSPDMMEGWSANATNTGFIRLMGGYGLTTINRERVKDWDSVVVKEHEEKDNEDGSKTFTVTINDNLKFSDGSKITASDYLFQIMLKSSKNFVELEGDATYGSPLVGYKEFNDGTTKEFKSLHLIDEYTFSFDMEAENLPNYYMLDEIGFEPLPMAAIAPGTEIIDDGNGCYFNDKYTTEVLRETLLDPETGFRYKRPVVAGPYKIKNVELNTETVELEINEEFLGLYDGTKPHIESIISKPVAEETWRDEFEKGNVSFYQTGKGEAIDATLSKVEDGDLKANYGLVPSDTVNEWRFACDVGPSQFPEVRRAFAYIQDRDEMNKQLTGGYASVVDCITTEAMGDYQATKEELEASLTHYSYDLDKAKQELISGGWTKNESGGEFQEGTDKVRYKEANGELMPLILKWAYTETESTTLHNTVVPPEAEKIGMKLEGTKMDFSQLITKLNRENGEAEYNVFSCAITLPEISAWWYFFDDSPERMGLWNYYRVSDPELKAITSKMKNVKPGDTEAYQKLFVEFQKEINKKMPGVVTTTGTSYFFYDPELKNFVPRPFDGWWGMILDAYVE